MQETLNSTTGVGLAANQVGIPLRIIIVKLGDEQVVMYNPVIIESSGEQGSFEGCLSLGKYRGKITRPRNITVNFIGGDHEQYSLPLSDFDATIVCHEIDHLNGKIIPDNITTKFKKTKELAKLKKALK